MNKFFIVINGAENGSWGEEMWKDVTQSTQYDVILLKSPMDISKNLLKKLYKLHFSNLINKYVSLPFKNVWDIFCRFPKVLNKSNQNYVIFQTGIKISPSLIKNLKNNYNCKIILYMPDTVETIFKINSKDRFEKWLKTYQVDEVYSFDKCDSEKYGFKHFDFYSKIVFEDRSLSYDVCYVGNCRQKNRLEIINYISNRVSNGFYVLNGLSSNDISNSNIIRNRYYPYIEYLRYALRSRCLIEIMNGKQNGFTLRAKEAIVYNKKLITNNKEILSSTYYNPRFIQYFDNYEDIDFNWISDNSIVDFHYNGEFSPINIIEDLLKTSE